MVKEEILIDKEKRRILCRVIAHLMGDGCVTNKYFAYFNKNETLLNNYRKDVLSLFGNIHLTTGKYNSGVRLIQVQNKEIISFLRGLVKDFKSNGLEFPEFVKDNQEKVEFLKAIYDDEGCVALRTFRKTNEIKRNITLSSNSSKFLEQIKTILYNEFSIISNKIIRTIKIKNSKEYVNYVLSITGRDNFLKFREKIRFYHPDKIQKLDKMINSYIRIPKR